MNTSGVRTPLRTGVNREYDVATFYEETVMSFVEVERSDGLMVVRLNRPALSHFMSLNRFISFH